MVSLKLELCWVNLGCDKKRSRDKNLTLNFSIISQAWARLLFEKIKERENICKYKLKCITFIYKTTYQMLDIVVLTPG